MSFFNLEIPKDVMSEAVRKYVDGYFEIKSLSKSINGVFEVQTKATNFIIRFSNPLKLERHIHGEIDFIQYLYANGVSVAKPLLSKENKIVENVNVDEKYIVTAFEKAHGKIVDIYNEDEWNCDFFKKWGETIGKIHKATKKYIPSLEQYKRGEWNEECIKVERSIFDPYLTLQKPHEKVLWKWKDLIKELSCLPKCKDCYGLVHGDLHALNFFVSNGQVTVFDFDDCCYNWFAYDISIAFYDSLYGIPFEHRNERREFLKYFSNCFFEGYNSENTISEYWMKQIPLFIKFRDYLLYMVSVTHLDIDKLDVQQIESLNYVRRNIENDIPVVDFN